MKKLSSGKAGPGIAGTVKVDEPKPVHSEKLTRMLTAQRTAAIQAALASRPDVALAAIVHQLALQVFSNRYVSNRLVQINLERPYLKNDAEDIEQSAAAAELEKKRSQWVERIEAAGQGGPDLFGWAAGAASTKHVSNKVLSVVTEAVSAGKADLLRGLKKQQLVRKADEELSSLRWLPDNLKCETQPR